MLFALILTVTLADGRDDTYALDTGLTLTDCMTALAAFPLDGTSGSLSCEWDRQSSALSFDLLPARPADHEPTPAYCPPLFALHDALGDSLGRRIYSAVNRVCGDF